MNENHSLKELVYRRRLLAPLLASALQEHPVVVLTGARQTGKSTLLRQDRLFNGWKYITFDDLAMVSQSRKDPQSLWADSDKIILDEVQKVPHILSAIKQTVDANRQQKRFLLSGSANLLLMNKVGESLAGRAVYFPLYPMTVGEINASAPSRFLIDAFSDVAPSAFDAPVVSPLSYMLQGLMPALLTLATPQGHTRWWEGYIATYLERDLRQLSQIESLPEYHRCMQSIALRSGQLVNQTEVARDIGIGQSTVHRYLNMLETTCLLLKVPAFARNKTTRLVKSAKVYFIDPGLSSFLCGYFNEESLRLAREVGGIFESLVLLHLAVQSELMQPKAKIFFWRTVTGHEVDFVVEYGRKLVPVEVKLSSDVGFNITENIRKFMDDYPEASRGYVIYTGSAVKQLTEKIFAIPWTML